MEDALVPLVDINSYTENPEGGRQVGTLLRELFAIDGLEFSARPSERYADHLVFRSRPAAPNRDAVALVGHLDTVFPPGTFEGYRRDGALARGPGVLDMKGGLVVVAFALKAVAASGGPRRRGAPVRVVIVSDEEVGSPGGAGRHRGGGRRIRRVPRLRGRPRSRRDSDPPQRHGRDGRGVPWARGARRQRTRRRSERNLGARPVRRRGPAAHAITGAAPPSTWAASPGDRPRTRSRTVPRRSSISASAPAPTVTLLVAAVRRAAPTTRRRRCPGRAGSCRVASRASRFRSRQRGRAPAPSPSMPPVRGAHGLGSGEAPLHRRCERRASTAASLGIPAIDGLGPRGAGFSY